MSWPPVSPVLVTNVDWRWKSYWTIVKWPSEYSVEMPARPDSPLISVPSVGTRLLGQAGSSGATPAPPPTTTWRPSTPERCRAGASGFSLLPGSWWRLTLCWWEQVIMRTHSHSNNGFSAQITCSVKTKKKLRSRKCRENVIRMEITRPLGYNYKDQDFDYWPSKL